ncbi:hypothetical protein ElyMa_004167600 [Elysia marginata]|uniref:Uncharacterized protein n=1 Tax=Elysia marginata TaxID=1093978 RepID=A0AAV4GHG6_9GAST|nr:hypothetical protein ElyMa_004167600 [Elysia marginata]
MEAYFVRKGGKFLGRPITTLPNVLNKFLSRLPTGELRLKTNEDLDHLRSIAPDRQQWKGLTTKIREAAEASSTNRRPPLWPCGKDTRSELGRYGFDPRPSHTKDLKIGTVLVADPPGVWHYGFSAKSSRPGVRLM